MRALPSFALVLLLGACAGAQRSAVPDPPVPPMEESQQSISTDVNLDQVKQSAATQLECPVEQVNVVCVRRDSSGDCVAVRANGCERVYEYQFGDAD